jgi:putative ABC transport system permease protein
MVFRAFALLAVLIACLGLFGLSAYSAEVRIKEIGIRKVLGASVPGLVSLLSRDFAKLVLAALVLAWPLGWLAMDRWLRNFAYRTGIGFENFLLSGLLALAVALATISYQSVKAALADPVHNLRYE